jgi:hypothetical protein
MMEWLGGEVGAGVQVVCGALVVLVGGRWWVHWWLLLAG